MVQNRKKSVRQNRLDYKVRLLLNSDLSAWTLQVYVEQVKPPFNVGAWAEFPKSTPSGHSVAARWQAASPPHHIPGTNHPVEFAVRPL